MIDPQRSPAVVVESYLSSFDTRDPDHIASHVSENFSNRHTSVLGGSGCDGHDAYRERLGEFLSSMIDLHYEIETLIADGPEVAAFYTMTGRWQGTAPFAIRGVQRLHVQDTKITTRTDYWDSAGFLSQVDSDAKSQLAALGLA